MDDDTRSGLRIGELARRADVPRATIQFYVREQLLPPPVKTGRTMAYYAESCVDRVKLIKELQRRYLPLSAIRPMLDAADGEAGVADVARAGDRIRRALQPPARAMTRAQVLAHTKVPEESLEVLERLGVVSPSPDKKYAPWDVAIMQAVSKLQASGVTAAAGFDVADLALYRDAMSGLLEKEVAAFSRSLLGARASRAKRSPEDVVRLAIAAAVGATNLIVAIRGKLIDELVGAAAGKRKKRKG